MKIVRMGNIVLLFLLLTWSVFAAAPGESGVFLVPNQPMAGVGLAWDPSPDTNVTGYVIYYGTNGSRQYTQTQRVGNITNTTLTQLVRGVAYYISATAYNSQADESDFCNEVIYQTPALPKPPSNIKTNVSTVKVSLERSPSPKGPWEDYLELFAFTETPSFYRSHLSISMPAEVPYVRRSTYPPIPGK